MRYEAWLQQQDGAINQQLKYYEAEILKIRKQRKVTLSITFGILSKCWKLFLQLLTIIFFLSQIKSNLSVFFYLDFSHGSQS